MAAYPTLIAIAADRQRQLDAIISAAQWCKANPFSGTRDADLARSMAAYFNCDLPDDLAQLVADDDAARDRAAARDSAEYQRSIRMDARA